MSAIAQLPFLTSDANRRIEIFRTRTREPASKDCEADRREARSARANASSAFAARVAATAPFVASLDGVTAGCGSLTGRVVLDMLRKDAAFARRDVGTVLIDGLVRLVQARGSHRVASDVSDTARSTFESEGFVAEPRNTLAVGDRWLGTTTIMRTIAKTGATTRH